jgi:hypothetical protein
MTKLRNVLLIVMVAVLSLAVVSNAAPAKKLVYKVDRVTAKMEGNTVVIHAYGRVRTTGWKDAELVATKGTATILAFRFVAEKPTGIVSPMITPIDAEKTTSPLLPPFPRKVKIIAETNSKTVTITH